MARLLKIWLALVLGFLYLPILVMIAMAFNQSALYELPFQFDWKWFAQLSQNERLLSASFNSIWIALATTIIATTIGTCAALGLARFQFRGRKLLQILLLPPITIPWLITGTAMLIFFFWSGIGRGLHAILLGHVALAIPYVVLVVGAQLQSHGPQLEEAAQSLGANAWEVFYRINLPILAPSIMAAAAFAFAISFDQFVISYFLSPPGVSTLPVEIYTAIRKGFTPEINAISSLIILFSMGLMLFVARHYRFGGNHHGRD